MKYKVGDKVREDLEVGKRYGECYFSGEMEEYRGKQANIEKVHIDNYDLDIDKDCYFWTDEMLEPVAETIAESNKFTKEDFKFGDVVTLRNGDEYIYIKKKIINEKDYEYWIETYNKDFTYEDEITRIPELDIIKVQRYMRKGNGSFDLVTLYERKEEILTEKEREWLKNVINAFEVKILFIRKDSDDFQIKLGIAETFYPTIKLNLIKYKFEGMEDGEEYTLEELGL